MLACTCADAEPGPERDAGEFYADQTLRQVRNVVIPAWYNRKGYVESLAKLIAQKCDLFADKPGGAGMPHATVHVHSGR